MAFLTRCPECKAKLRFDDAPDPDEAIECARCGHVFDASEAKPLKKKQKALVGAGGNGDDKPRKKKEAGFEKPKSKAPKKRKVIKKKANLFFLWLMVGAALVFGPIVGYFGYKLFYSAGKVGALMAYVPPDCNLMRGIDVTRLSKYPGYDAQLKTAMDGPFAACRDEFAKALNADAAKFLDYAMSAKCLNGGSSGSMVVFQTTEPFDTAALFKGLGGAAQNVDGQEVYKLGAKPDILNNAYIYSPAERHIVVIGSDGDSMRMLKGSIAARAVPKETSIRAKLGDCGKKTSRANIWTLMRAEGDLAGKLREQIGDPLKNALGTLAQNVNKTKMFGVWIYFGKAIKYGVGIECDSSDAASDLVKAMKDSELGKRDDADIPRDLSAIFFIANNRNKDFVEFMSTLKFAASGNCAYLEARMPMEKSMMMLGETNKPGMWESSDSGGVAPGGRGLRR